MAYRNVAYRKSGMDEAKIAQLYKKGRGQGQGCHYKPWLTIYDLASLGRSHRVFGLKTGRIHHFLSDGEWRTFLYLDWCGDVADIREQFPLDREQTRRIADGLGVRHPVDNSGRVFQVMSTDFLIDVWRDGKLRLEACAVKRSEDLDNKRTLEKLEIERRYWADRDVPWHLLTERDFDPVVTQNLQWLRSLRFQKQREPWCGFHQEQAEAVLQAVPHWGSLSLREFCQSLDRDLDLEVGSSLTLIRHLLLTRRVTVDLTRPLTDHRVMSDFQVRPPMAGREVG